MNKLSAPALAPGWWWRWRKQVQCCNAEEDAGIINR